MPEEKVIENLPVSQEAVWTAGEPHGHTIGSDEDRLKKLEAFMDAVKQDTVLGGMLERGQQGAGGALWRAPSTAQTDWIIQDSGGPGVSTQFAKLYGRATSDPAVGLEAQAAVGTESLIQATSLRIDLSVAGGGTANALAITKSPSSIINLTRNNEVVLAVDGSVLQLANPAGDIMLELTTGGFSALTPSGVVRLQLVANNSYLGDQTGTFINVDTSNNDVILTAEGATTLSFTVVETAVIITDLTSGVTLGSFTRNPVNSGETALALRYNASGTQKTDIVHVGAADSGGAGWRMVRVPN
jgi:hypothetical protein